jgi:hypothetical protein
MKEHSHCMPEACPWATENGKPVSIYVAPNHPLVQRRHALP